MGVFSTSSIFTCLLRANNEAAVSETRKGQRHGDWVPRDLTFLASRKELSGDSLSPWQTMGLVPRIRREPTEPDSPTLRVSP